MTGRSDRETTLDAIAFTRALSAGDIDDALAIHRRNDSAAFAVALGGMLGGIIATVEDIGSRAGFQPWDMLVRRAEELT